MLNFIFLITHNKFSNQCKSIYALPEISKTLQELFPQLLHYLSPKWFSCPVILSRSFPRIVTLLWWRGLHVPMTPRVMPSGAHRPDRTTHGGKAEGEVPDKAWSKKSSTAEQVEEGCDPNSCEGRRSQNSTLLSTCSVSSRGVWNQKSDPSCHGSPCH